MRRIILAFLLLLSACSPAAPPIPTLTPTVPALEGNVDILYPEDGSVIYSEALTISGMASVQDFVLKLIAPDEQIIAQTTVQTQVNDWKVELPHGYNGDPIEVNIIAEPVNATANSEYDIATIVLSSKNNRPEGIFGNITAPSDGDTIGGEDIQISGTASGLPDGALSIALLGADGKIIDSHTVALYNPYVIDDMPWTAELATNDYTGSAEIRISNQDNLIASIKVTVTAEAG